MTDSLANVVIPYARFVECQERRRRIAAELTLQLSLPETSSESIRPALALYPHPSTPGDWQPNPHDAGIDRLVASSPAMDTTRPLAGGLTGRGSGVSFSRERCVRDSV
jgi:hypothetical protein